MPCNNTCLMGEICGDRYLGTLQPPCASHLEGAAPSASTNTGSPKLPTFGDCVQAVETRRGYGLSDSETVLLLYAHDIIERQLRASA